MAKKLMILGHPTIEQSLANSTIVSAVQQNVQDIEIRNLAQLYPDYKINVLAEQEALIKADIVIFQFPFYWYGVPAILKKYIDDVYTYQFAYGSEGDKLKGKKMQLSFTTGASEADYTPIGIENYRLPEFLKPLEQTAYYTGMDYLDPVFTQTMMYIPGLMGIKEEVVVNAKVHAERLIDKITQAEQSLEAVA
ncbi:NAD(P)H-dependent oxidoreductase [Mucilaginibacter sp. FT3.2]|uniref:NAD(P)H-dependent oxidoreductase n=1 Tax=Mucilaginibacter sp. FT3.2 TaxID=2723090 RepID=UPI00160D960B|nr:NAD(P)H-dependent oxidoreductase [Mucilaginibacter sp. FT3.2]MBB6233843.1 putative NADPH-quinone reductase [Mucilaginibacter sp. FT3.2]